MCWCNSLSERKCTVLTIFTAEHAKKRMGFTFNAQEVELARHALSEMAQNDAVTGEMCAPLAAKLLKRLAREGLKGTVSNG